MKYRIVGNGYEFKIQEFTKPFWFWGKEDWYDLEDSCDFDGALCTTYYDTKSKALLRLAEIEANDARIFGPWEPVQKADNAS